MIVTLLSYLIFVLSTICTGLGVLAATVHVLALFSQEHMLVLSDQRYRSGWLVPVFSLSGLASLIALMLVRDFGTLGYIIMIWVIGSFVLAGMIGPCLRCGARSEQ